MPVSFVDCINQGMIFVLDLFFFTLLGSTDEGRIKCPNMTVWKCLNAIRVEVSWFERKASIKSINRGLLNQLSEDVNEVVGTVRWECVRVFRRI